MADLKISALTDGGAIQGDDLVAVARAGASYKAKPVGADGWVSDTAETWAYVSATSFKVTGTDVTAKYTTGTRLRCKQGAGYKYFVVVSSAFSTDTTVTVTGGSDYSLANSAITDNYHSYAANPQGYPGWFNFNPSLSGWSGSPTLTARFAVIGTICYVAINISAGTSNATTATAVAPIASNANANAIVAPFVVVDNGAVTNTPGRAVISGGSSTITFQKDYSGNTWTASGTKRVIDLLLLYEI